MELRHLRLFLKVVEHGSISAAAQELGMAQPILSRHIRRLEEELSAKLLDRLPRGVAPTQCGRILLSHVAAIDANYRSALREITSVQRASAGRIVVGAGHSWLHGRLAVAVARLATRNPGARIKIVAESPDKLLPLLLRGDVDLALAPIALTDHYSGLFDSEALITADLVVFGAKEHPAAGQGTRTFSDLAKHRWALPRGTYGRTTFDRLLDLLDAPPIEPVIEVDDVLSLLDIVADSDLLTFGIFPGQNSADARRFARIDCPELTARRQTGAVFRRGVTVPPLCFALVDELRAVTAEGGDDDIDAGGV